MSDSPNLVHEIVMFDNSISTLKRNDKMIHKIGLFVTFTSSRGRV